MANYNLSDNVQDDWPFEVKGLKFRMRYPMTDEVEEIQKMARDIDTAQEEKREEDVERLSKKMEEYMYDFISGVDHETPIKEVLKSVNIKVMRNFNAMIRQELSI